MEPNSPAEELPALYRAILDRVAELEATGDRADAGRLRRDATRAYSRAWDDRARRQLETLLRRATVAGPSERAIGRRPAGADTRGGLVGRARTATAPDR